MYPKIVISLMFDVSYSCCVMCSAMLGFDVLSKEDNCPNNGSRKKRYEVSFFSMEYTHLSPAFRVKLNKESQIFRKL